MKWLTATCTWQQVEKGTLELRGVMSRFMLTATPLSHPQPAAGTGGVFVMSEWMEGAHEKVSVFDPLTCPWEKPFWI